MPRFALWATPVAERQLRKLRGETRKAAKRAMDGLERRGCEAADWRLEGDEVERFCVLDLGRDWRMVVAFPEEREVAIVLVARHLQRRPGVDVYTRLYENLGIRTPTVTQRKGHPPCCPEGEPPVDRDLVDAFIAREKELRRAGRSR